MIISIIVASAIFFTTGNLASCDIDGKSFEQCVDNVQVVHEYRK
jgi:hypothetical protein